MILFAFIEFTPTLFKTLLHSQSRAGFSTKRQAPLEKAFY